MEILGLVENMSGLVCPHCGGSIDLFESNGGLATAHKENLPLLGCLPLEPKVVQNGDQGHLQELTNSTLAYAQSFAKVVEAIVASTQSNGDDAFRSD